jgi:hypothetical protein
MVMVVDDYGLRSSPRLHAGAAGFVERDLADTDCVMIVRTSEDGTRPLSLTSERSALRLTARIRITPGRGAGSPSAIPRVPGVGGVSKRPGVAD